MFKHQSRGGMVESHRDQRQVPEQPDGISPAISPHCLVLSFFTDTTGSE